MIKQSISKHRVQRTRDQAPSTKYEVPRTNQRTEPNLKENNEETIRQPEGKPWKSIRKHQENYKTHIGKPMEIKQLYAMTF